MAVEQTAPPTHHLYQLEQDEESKGELIIEHVKAADHVNSGVGTAALQGPRGERIDISDDLFYMLETMIRQIRQGQAVQIVTYGRDLTTQQAAEILNVSRQYLVRLLERDEIPFTKTEGNHRRLKLQDVLDYRRRRSEQRRASLDRIAQASVDMGHY